MKIAVVGTGYVGLVTGTCFAEMGNDVTCIDIDATKIEKMKQGEIPIYEPDLEGLFKRTIDAGRLHFTTSLSDGIQGAEIIFLALPTPPGEDGSADLSYILGVADELGPLLKSYAVIVDKSTVPVGTAARVTAHIQKGATVPFSVVSNPEFLREGFAVADFMQPDRVVIGTTSNEAKAVLDELYAPIARLGSPIIYMDERSAELTKYAANAFLATKISFMNEIANLCELVGADVDAVREGIGPDERIGKRFLYPGIGYGGSCFPKDVMALHKTAMDHDYTFKILEAVTDVNQHQKQKLSNKIREQFGDDLEGRVFAVWGLAFKPDTDDIREAPALEIIKDLVAAGARIAAYDPEAMNNAARLFEGEDHVIFGKDEYAVLEGADALVIATEWEQFRSPDFDKMKKRLKTPLVFDGRNLYDIDAMAAAGFEYTSIGRKRSK